jgi:hypothetical protein
MPASVTAHKGTLPCDMKKFDLEPTATLDSVRAILTRDNFLEPDRNTRKFRFVLKTSTSSNAEDVTCPISAENKFVLNEVLRPGNQLIFSDIAKLKDTDLAGIATDQFFSRYLGVRIWLNNIDDAAKQTNASIKAFKPLLLTNVYPTNPNANGFFDNVCVVVENSVVGFDISSWGAVGFNYYIAPSGGDPIVDGELYCSFGGTPNQFRTVPQRRYYGKAQTIQIVGADTVGIPSGDKEAILRFQKVTFRSRRMTYYEQDNRSFESNEMPPQPQARPAMKAAAFAATGASGFSVERQLANADRIGISPGDAQKPGGPVAGPPSQQNWSAPISNARTDDWQNALGEVVVYFFVFKTWEQANQVINGYNAPDPTIWS